MTRPIVMDRCACVTPGAPRCDECPIGPDPVCVFHKTKLAFCECRPCRHCGSKLCVSDCDEAFDAQGPGYETDFCECGHWPCECDASWDDDFYDWDEDPEDWRDDLDDDDTCDDDGVWAYRRREPVRIKPAYACSGCADEGCDECIRCPDCDRSYARCECDGEPLNDDCNGAEGDAERVLPWEALCDELEGIGFRQRGASEPRP